MGDVGKGSKTVAHVLHRGNTLEGLRWMYLDEHLQQAQKYQQMLH
jgi:hypothetical protein